MYLANLKLWNFRKYGSPDDLNLSSPDLNLDFTPGLNILIGENDSGKTAIVDAIKLVLKTHSYEWIRLTPEDFYEGAQYLRIELLFCNLSDDEAKHFTRFLTPVTNADGTQHVELKVMYDAQMRSGRIIPSDIKAGGDPDGSPLPAEAREFLKTTYLKPLRDAKSELVPRKGSRLSQILSGHAAFQGDEDSHHLMGVFKYFNESVEHYFKGELLTSAPGEAPVATALADLKGKDLKEEIDRYIKSFFGADKSTQINISKGNLTSVLERLLLSMQDDFNLGLGSLNRLFMASELLHLNKVGYEGLRLGLIEELEAHLHPQAQMQIIEALQQEENIQLILTTHSPNLASKVSLKHLIFCTSDYAFPLGESYTKLEPANYLFLERFLDVTKSNMLFSKSVVLVEGSSEEILLPAFARKLKAQGHLEKDLTQAGVSVVNVGNLQFQNYSKIFLRKETEHLIDIPVAIITDCDVPRHTQTPNINPATSKKYDYDPRIDVDAVEKETQESETELKVKFEDQSVQVYVGQYWTLEYCLIKSCLRNAFIHTILQEYPQFDLDDPERALASKLYNKFEKSKIPYLLAQILDDGEFPKIDADKKPVLDADGNQVMVQVTIDATDAFIGYIIEALTYTCND
jgi:putative ATP-dependent endonuclease of OLD family